jgi:hypothetical protein
MKEPTLQQTSRTYKEITHMKEDPTNCMLVFKTNFEGYTLWVWGGNRENEYGYMPIIAGP